MIYQSTGKELKAIKNNIHYFIGRAPTLRYGSPPYGVRLRLRASHPFGPSRRLTQKPLHTKAQDKEIKGVILGKVD